MSSFSHETKRLTENQAPKNEDPDKERECPICFGEITREVRSTCRHSFCGKCLMTFWKRNRRLKLQCPLCRTSFSDIFCSFLEEKVLSEDLETKTLIEDIKSYNRCFSDQPRTFFQIIQDFPSLCIQKFHSSHMIYTFCMFFVSCFITIGMMVLANKYKHSIWMQNVVDTFVKWIQNEISTLAPFVCLFLLYRFVRQI